MLTEALFVELRVLSLIGLRRELKKSLNLIKNQ